jgi:hypothetical protein
VKGHGDLFATVDLADAVDRALARLPDEFRQAIILVDLENPQLCSALAKNFPSTVRFDVRQIASLLGPRGARNLPRSGCGGGQGPSSIGMSYAARHHPMPRRA